MLLKKYRFGFDISGLVIFLIVMIPNFIWFAVPAPNDILRNESVTAIVDMIGSIFQVLFIGEINEYKKFYDENFSLDTSPLFWYTYSVEIRLLS